ncbi:hypothetical protein G6F43_007337 [Rhizopus delemar]|nr:hypothetical protein G6F43_007337 [Rhizopus delemar]
MFKTYTTPKNSKILVSTGEFGKECPRRYEDTELILREFADVYGRIQNHLKDHPDTPKEHLLDQLDRKEKAIKRLNGLHGKYNVGNDDFLYTLTMFITEPVAWINKHLVYQKENKFYSFIIYVAFMIRTFFIRHFMLPCKKFSVRTPFYPNSNGKYVPNYFVLTTRSTKMATTYQTLDPEKYVKEKVSSCPFALPLSRKATGFPNRFA